MNNDYTLLFNGEKLLEMYATLPDDIKRAIFSVDTAKQIMRIGKKYSLSIDQIGELGTHTGMVMVGALHPRGFIQELEKSFRIDRTKATEIGKEINHEIFFPIREELKRIHSMEDAGEILSEKEVGKGDALKNISDRRIIGKIPEESALKKEIPPPASSAPITPPPRPAESLPSPKPKLFVPQIQKQQTPQIPIPPNPNTSTNYQSQTSLYSEQNAQKESAVPQQQQTKPLVPETLPQKESAPQNIPQQRPLGSGSRSLEEKFSIGKSISQEPSIRPMPEWATKKAPEYGQETQSKPQTSQYESSTPINPLHQQSAMTRVETPTQSAPIQQQKQPPIQTRNNEGDQYREPIE